MCEKNGQGEEENDQGLLGTGTQCTMIPKAVGEVLAGAKVRSEGHGVAVGDGIEVEV